jgi:hypothetical protein
MIRERVIMPTGATSWPMDPEFLADLNRGPTHCDKCGRRAELRERIVHREMAAFMVEICRLDAKDPGGYHHTRAVLGTDAPKASTDAAYLAHPVFGLLRRQGKGLYLVTRAGHDWVSGSSMVPARFWTYGGDVYAVSDEQVDIAVAWSREPGAYTPPDPTQGSLFPDLE